MFNNCTVLFLFYLFFHITETKRRRVPVSSSYIGCLRNVQINQATLSFKSVTNVFGSIDVNECPAE